MEQPHHRIYRKRKKGGNTIMNDQLRSDLIAYKMRAAKDLLPEIKSHIDNGFYNTAMNRMYYACFNAATALLIAEKVPEMKRHFPP